MHAVCYAMMYAFNTNLKLLKIGSVIYPANVSQINWQDDSISSSLAGSG